MERKIYEFTEKKLQSFERRGLTTWAESKGRVDEIRSGADDEALKADWKRRHHGKTRGWGMGKAQAIVDIMEGTIDYQLGLWQGRVDKARGLGYSEERLEAPYNIGYYRGYDEYESNRRGWDRGTRARFDAQYVEV